MNPSDVEVNLDHLPALTPTARVLRPYQHEAVAAVLEDWANEIRRVGVVLPTGTGKSSVIGALVSTCYRMGLRLAILAHRMELLDQIRDNILAVDPTIPPEHIGLVRASHDDHHAPIVVATFQTLANEGRRKSLGDRQALFVDETHHIIAEGYHDTFVQLGGYDGAFFCGFTATMFRGEKTKGKATSIGLGDVFQKISYEKDLRWAIEEGYLVRPQGLTVRIDALNALNKVKNVAGDFNQKELAEIMEAAVDYTVDAVEKHASDRRSIIFAASVEACRLITDELNSRGNLRAGTIVGDLSYEDRQPIYDAFRRGDIDCMVTVMVLSEGADFPMCDCVVMGRPTRSRITYSQMVGRALRLYESKSDALVLDLSGSTRQMRLVHLSELVHGIGDITIDEVDEDGEIIEPELCAVTGQNRLTCICPGCMEDRQPVARGANKRRGPVDMTPIDLLADGDDTLWLRTPAGVYFIPLDDGWNVFIWPKDGDATGSEWSVGNMNTRSFATNVAYHEMDPETGKPVQVCDIETKQVRKVEAYFPMATALRKAVEWCQHHRKDVPLKNQSWRTRNQAPSDLQSHLARNLGIASWEGMTKGRLSDEISLAMFAPLVDEMITVRNTQIEGVDAE